MVDGEGGSLSTKAGFPAPDNSGARVGPETAAEQWQYESRDGWPHFQLVSPAKRRLCEIKDEVDAVQIAGLLNDGLVLRRLQRGALGGPETAAEHVRNALMLIDCAALVDANASGMIRVDAWKLDLDAIRARLARALAALEGSGS